LPCGLKLVDVTLNVRSLAVRRRGNQGILR
jgi:hypothetical protein